MSNLALYNVKFDVLDAKFDVPDVKFDVADVKFGVFCPFGHKKNLLEFEL